jgi:hypothetical protein
MAPAAAYDTCYQLWITFGTGDRDRPRTNFNPDPNLKYDYGGRFITLRDNGKVNHITENDIRDAVVSSTLVKFTWGGTDNETLIAPSTFPVDVNGMYFNFPDTGERLFEPEPIILPDEYLVPHIYFNTYQPPPEYTANQADPCDLPKEGLMTIYDIALKSCGTLEDIEGERETGRIAGGGIYAGKEYVMYKSESGDVADVPGGEGGQFTAETIRLPYPGGLVFWKEKKR